MSEPTINEIVAHVAEHYGLTLERARAIMRTPIHPAGLRDEFAASAVVGLMGRDWSQHQGTDLELMAKWARSSYLVADEMMKARVAS